MLDVAQLLARRAIVVFVIIAIAAGIYWMWA